MVSYKRSLKPDRLYRLARIDGFHGLDGTIKLTPFYKGFSLAAIPFFYLNSGLKLTNQECRYYKGRFYLKAIEITEPREIIKGKDIFTEKQYLSDLQYPLLEDVQNKQFISENSGKVLGEYSGHQYHGDQLTYVISGNDGQEYLIPAIIDQFIKKITDQSVIVDDSIFN